MKKIFTYFKKKYLFLLAFLVSTLLSIGASTWLVIRENEFKPGYVKLQTPIVLSYTITNPSVYEYQIEDANGEVTLNTLMRVCGISITPDVSVNGSVDCTNLDEIYFVSNTTGNPYEVKANFTFTPNDQDNYLEASVEVPIKINPICYAGSNYYGSLNRALEAAGTTPVAIIPGHKDFIIHRDVTIGSDQTVVVPYDTYWNNSTITNSSGEVKTDGAVGWDKKEPNAKGTIYHQYSGTTTYAFSDTNSTTVGTYKKTEITLAENRTITNLGELSVLGELGGYTHGLSGHTSGRYAQITLKSNAKIDNQGLMEVRGYVKEASATNGSQVINQNGGELNLPFVIYDNQGARPTIGMYMAGNIFPYNGFNFPNIHSKIISYGNSNIYGLGSMFTGSLSAGMESIGLSIKIDPQHNLIKIPLFIAHNSTTSGMYVLSSATSRVEMTYTPYNFGYTENRWSNGRDANYSMRGVTDINFFGGANTGYINLSIFLGNPDPIVLDTRGTNFPISWLLDIELNDGEYEITQQLKIMSGSRMKVNFGATLHVASPTVVYSTFNDVVSGASTEYPYISSQNGLLIGNGGNITIAAQFGGIVHAEGNNRSNLNITTTNLTNKIVEGTGDFTTSASEILNKLGGLLGGGIGKALEIMDYMNGKTSVTFNDIKGHIIKLSSATFVSAPDENARGYIYTKGNKSSGYQNFAQASYISYNGGWSTGNYTVNVLFNSNGGSSVATHTAQLGHHEKLTISQSYLDQFVTTKEHYTFGDWVLSDGSSPIGLTTNSDVALKATWLVNDYTINYDLSSKYMAGTEAIGTGTNNQANVTDFNYETGNIKFLDPTHSEEYYFEGWYLDEACTIKIPTAGLSGADLAAYVTNKQVTVYALWYDRPTTITYINSNADYSTELKSTTVPSEQSEYAKYVFPTVNGQNDSIDYGYYFVGYYLDEAYTKPITSISLDGGFTQSDIDAALDSRQINIYVNWEQKVHITYQTNNENGLAVPDSLFLRTVDLSSYSLPVEQMKTYNDNNQYKYYFHTWQYQGSDITGLTDTLVGDNREVVLTGGFEQKVHITYQTNNENGLAVPGSLYLRAVNLSSYSLPVEQMKTYNSSDKHEWYFRNWQYQGSDITGLTDTLVGDNKEVVLTGGWDEKIRVSYSVDGKNGLGAPVSSFVHSSQLTTYVVPIESMTIYNSNDQYEWYFRSWQYQGADVSKLTTEIVGTSKEVVLTAGWDQKVKVIYSTDGSNGLSAPGYVFVHSSQWSSYELDISTLATQNNVTTAQFFFTGWEYNGTLIDGLGDIDVGSLLEITLTAGWDQKVLINYSSNGENGIATPESVYKHSSEFDAYTLPDMTSGNATGEYYFHYWQYNGNDITGGKLTTSIVGNATEVTLVARWERKVTITYYGTVTDKTYNASATRSTIFELVGKNIPLLEALGDYEVIESDTKTRVFRFSDYTISYTLTDGTAVEVVKMAGETFTIPSNVLNSSISIRPSEFDDMGIKINSVSISANPTTGKGQYDTTITVKYEPSTADLAESSAITWTGVSNLTNKSTTINGNEIVAVYTIPSASRETKYTIKVTIKDKAGNSVSSEEITVTAQKNSACFTRGTEIMLANGEYEKIENLKVGDLIKTINHETGELENQIITFIPYQTYSNYEVLELCFEDGEKIKVLFAHGFMNATTRQYEEISKINVEECIGNSYVTLTKEGEISYSKLVGYNIYVEYTESYSLASAYNLNHIIEGYLCMSDDISGLYNYFELDEEFKYDKEKKEKDLELYGLLSYDEVDDFMTKEIYDMFNVKYLSVSIGKGMIDMETMREYIKLYA